MEPALSGTEAGMAGIRNGQVGSRIGTTPRVWVIPRLPREGVQVQQIEYSPRGRSKGKAKAKGKGKGKTKSEQNTSPFGAGKGGPAPLPAWPSWTNPDVGSSPFQAAQSSKSSTMQEMATHLRLAYKDSEAPADVQAFLEKADKEYSRNNIKSLQAATKSLDHAQKALRDAVNAKERPSSPVDKTRWRGHQDLGSPAGQLQGPSSYSLRACRQSEIGDRNFQKNLEGSQ